MYYFTKKSHSCSIISKQPIEPLLEKIKFLSSDFFALRNSEYYHALIVMISVDKINVLS